MSFAQLFRTIFAKILPVILLFGTRPLSLLQIKLDLDSYWKDFHLQIGSPKLRKGFDLLVQRCYSPETYVELVHSLDYSLIIMGPSLWISLNFVFIQFFLPILSLLLCIWQKRTIIA
jgi:hypothetical protein